MSEQKDNVNVNEAKPGSEYVETGIDFSNVSALGNNDVQKVNGFVFFLQGLGEGIVKALLFVLGFLLDILKAIWSIISGVFIYIYRGIKAIGLFFRRMSRIFREVDVWGKWNFLLQGLGNIKHGQLVNGIVFMVVEVLFIAFMAISGVPSLIKLTMLDELYRTTDGQGDAPTRLILGIIAILVIVGYLVVYVRGTQSMYDCYQILHELDFRKAREDALDVIARTNEFEEDLTRCSHGKVYSLMRNKYGYNRLSALYISYVDFRRLPEKKPFALVRLIDGIKGRFYGAYLKWAKKVKAGKWSSVFADFLNWELVKRKPSTGLEVLKNEQEVALLRFRHTYDKYNDFHQVVRDSEAMLKCLRDPKMMIACAYADDEVSKRNSIAPISHDKVLKSKVILSRIVGYFEVSLEVGRVVSDMLAEVIKKNPTDEARIAALTLACEKAQKDLDEFKVNNRDAAIACAKGIQSALSEEGFKDNLAFFEKGKKDFMPHLMANYHLDLFHAQRIAELYEVAVKRYQDEASRIAFLAQAGKRYEPTCALLEDYAFHGQVLKFKKQAKQYLDEKFAVTVLALPTLGVILTTILPLLFSIVIAFTNWDSLHVARNFNWDLNAWANVFAMGEEGNSNFIVIFMTLLRWTLVWAVLATFSNYIAGIVLALMINKKGIKAKSLFRTCFVISIAIPQFITLLAINLLLSPDGAINTWLRATFGWKIPFLGKITNGTSLFELDPNYVFIKFIIVVVNMWVGIPYTMLSTSGILMNIPGDLYESAQIDGANAWTQFWKITMPYIIFVTGPSLLTTFIGNINNFNVIYFLTGGNPGMSDMIQGNNYYAGHTDLLITWLYKLTANPSNGKPEYAMGSVIGILMFAVCAFFSLIMYKRMGSVKNEEAFQ